MSKFILLISLLPFLLAAQDSPPLTRFKYQQPKIGTTIKLIFYASDTALANQLAAQAFARIDSLNLIFSDYLSTSEISRLSISAGRDTCIVVSSDMWNLLQLSQQISRQTNGYFDITIGALSKFWRKMILKQEFIGGVKLKHNKNKVNYRWLKLDKQEQCICLKRKGMRLDAGGIAKGYIIDEVFEVFKSAGVYSVLIDAGGDIRVGAFPPNSEGWKIGGLPQSMYLNDTAIATSGDTYRYLEWNGKRYSHLINPKTGYGVQDVAQISVIASTATLADAYASAFSVMPHRKSRRLAKRLGITLITN